MQIFHGLIRMVWCGWLTLGLCAMPGGVEGSGCTDFPDVETASERYRKRFSTPVGRWFLERQADFLVDLLREWPGTSILDIGGGHGQYTRVLVEHGYGVTVIGSRPETGRLIADLVESGDCRFFAGNLLSLPFPDHSFDIVTSFRLLAHLPDWRRLVSEATRVARRAVIMDFPVRRSFNCFYSGLFGLKQYFEHGSARPYTVFSEAEVRAAFAARGYVLTGRHAQYLLPMVAHRVLNRPGLSRALEEMFERLGITARFGSPVIARFEPT